MHSGVAERFVLTFMVIVHPCVKPGCNCKVFKVKQGLDYSWRLQHTLCQSLRLFPVTCLDIPLKQKPYLIMCLCGESHLTKSLWNGMFHKAQIITSSMTPCSYNQCLPSVPIQEGGKAQGCRGWCGKWECRALAAGSCRKLQEAAVCILSQTCS